MKFIDRFLPHLAISLCLGLLVLTVLDMYNPAFAFLTGTCSKVYYVCLTLTVVLVAVRHLYLTRDE